MPFGRDNACMGNVPRIREFRNRIAHHKPICFDIICPVLMVFNINFARKYKYFLVFI